MAMCYSTVAKIPVGQRVSKSSSLGLSCGYNVVLTPDPRSHKSSEIARTVARTARSPHFFHNSTKRARLAARLLAYVLARTSAGGNHNGARGCHVSWRPSTWISLTRPSVVQDTTSCTHHVPYLYTPTRIETPLSLTLPLHIAISVLRRMDVTNW